MIEVVSERNLDKVLPLIRKYQEFYKVAEISDAGNREFFSQLGEGGLTGCQFVYCEESKEVAFATVYFTYSSTIAAKVAVLNDLYTSPDMRGKGIGRQLIEHCHQFALSNGAVRFQWMTAIDNERAQKLYDSVGAKKSTWHIYTK
jgi:GNAT superfamily N-acetyltransferase